MLTASSSLTTVVTACYGITSQAWSGYNWLFINPQKWIILASPCQCGRSSWIHTWSDPTIEIGSHWCQSSSQHQNPASKVKKFNRHLTDAHDPIHAIWFPQNLQLPRLLSQGVIPQLEAHQKDHYSKTTLFRLDNVHTEHVHLKKIFLLPHS